MPAGSLAPLLTVAVYTVSASKLFVGFNVATRPVYATVHGTVVAPCFKLNVDVVIVERSIAQLNVAINTKNEKPETKNIKVISIAKRNKDLYIEGKKEFIPLKSLPQEIYNLVLQLDDEAHRFAITYHKKLRKKSLLS